MWLGLSDSFRDFEDLSRAIDERSILVQILSVDPLYDPLHPDRRFASLVESLKLDR